MKLQQMVSGGLTRIEEIGTYLDGLTHNQRLKEIHRLSPVDMARLFQRAGEGEEITLDHYVPEERADATEVIHHGFNSLPAFRRFQKRFCRSVNRASGETTVYGYNEGLTRPLVGPGYFVAHETAGVEHWEPRGAVVIDYHLPVDGPLPQRWPKFIPNEVGLQQFVYGKTRDFMRRVSDHVSIGAAFKYEQSLGVYFILTREP